MKSRINFLIVIGVLESIFLLFPDSIFSQEISERRVLGQDKNGKILLLNSIVSKYKISEDELKGFQVYPNAKIILRAVSSGSQLKKDIDNKSFSTENVTYRSEIVIPEYTPGVITKFHPVYGVDVDFGDDIIIHCDQVFIDISRYVGYSEKAYGIGDKAVVKVNDNEYKSEVLTGLGHILFNVALLVIDPINESAQSRTEMKTKTAPGKVIKN